ncbi:MAG: sigma-70 family RNA polymerase sigma factor [Planctomycetota bacterium]|jgi:RNA polymerase sigma-70 factor (ECF subfamily)
MRADDADELLRRAAAGDRDCLDQLLEQDRARLARMVQLRLDPRVRSRVAASDVIQEASLEAFRRLDEYLSNPKLPFFLWLRFLTGQKVLEMHRRHLGAQRRDARRELHLHRDPWPGATSTDLANLLLGKLTAPSERAIRAEQRRRLEESLNALAPLDRELVVLRHFEQLTNVEAAAELEIAPSAASKRYIRALKKLKEILVRMPGGEP